MVKVGGIVDVTLANGRKFPGRVWSMDESSDIALVKLDTSGRAASKLKTSFIIQTCLSMFQ